MNWKFKFLKKRKENQRVKNFNERVLSVLQQLQGGKCKVCQHLSHRF